MLLCLVDYGKMVTGRISLKLLFARQYLRGESSGSIHRLCIQKRHGIYNPYVSDGKIILLSLLCPCVPIINIRAPPTPTVSPCLRGSACPRELLAASDLLGPGLGGDLATAASCSLAASRYTQRALLHQMSPTLPI